MTQTLTQKKKTFLIFERKKKKKLDINKLVLIFSVFLQSYVHKYTGSVNCSNINIYFLYKYSYASGFTTESICRVFWWDETPTSAVRKNKAKSRVIESKSKKYQ